MKGFWQAKIIIPFLIVAALIPTALYYYVFHYRVIYQANTNKKIVAITIDDGPDPRFTPRMLDIFQKYNARATFFVVGKEAEKYPGLLQRIDREGHEIGNHTYSHPNLLQISRAEIADEITTDQRIIKQITGKNVKWFRPPKEQYGPSTNMVVNEKGLTMVLWKVGVENSQAKTPEAMADRVAKMVKPGWIILIHDGRLDRTKSVRALPILLEKLKAQGYSFVTLGELLKAE